MSGSATSNNKHKNFHAHHKRAEKTLIQLDLMLSSS